MLEKREEEKQQQKAEYKLEKYYSRSKKERGKKYTREKKEATGTEIGGDIMISIKVASVDTGRRESPHEERRKRKVNKTGEKVV